MKLNYDYNFILMTQSHHQLNTHRGYAQINDCDMKKNYPEDCSIIWIHWCLVTSLRVLTCVQVGVGRNQYIGLSVLHCGAWQQGLLRVDRDVGHEVGLSDGGAGVMVLGWVTEVAVTTERLVEAPALPTLQLYLFLNSCYFRILNVNRIDWMSYAHICTFSGIAQINRRSVQTYFTNSLVELS